MGVLQAMWAGMSLVTVVMTGWLLVPLGAFVGWGFAGGLLGEGEAED